MAYRYWHYWAFPRGKADFELGGRHRQGGGGEREDCWRLSGCVSHHLRTSIYRSRAARLERRS